MSLELRRVPSVFGFGLTLSLDRFVGVSILWGWWIIKVGVNRNGI